MFQLAEEGFDSPFEQLVACIISIRTLEETTLPASRRLFAVARAPADVARLARIIHREGERSNEAGRR